MKSWVPAEVPNAWLSPYPVGEWQTRAQVSMLLLPNAARTIFWTTYTSSLVQREDEMPPMEPTPYFSRSPRKPSAIRAIASSHDTTCHSSSMESRTIGFIWRSSCEAYP